MENQPADENLQHLLDDCKKTMHVKKKLDLVVTESAPSPALLGYFRPKLLVPRAMLGELSSQEWRCIFFHELSHLKRHDIPIIWLSTCLQALHWFNPLVWYAFRLMRADREIACDALALTSAGTDQSQDYAGTIVKLLNVYANPKPLSGIAAILETKSDLERRMNMIMHFNPTHQRWSILPIIALSFVALIGLTNAQEPSPAQLNQTHQLPKIQHTVERYNTGL